jgi:hypothetical protein
MPRLRLVRERLPGARDQTGSESERLRYFKRPFTQYADIKSARSAIEFIVLAAFSASVSWVNAAFLMCSLTFICIISRCRLDFLNENDYHLMYDFLYLPTRPHTAFSSSATRSRQPQSKLSLAQRESTARPKNRRDSAQRQPLQAPSHQVG